MRNNEKKKIDRLESIVFSKEGNEILKDAYLRLKDSILYYCIDNVKKVIQIESSVQAEGKTTTVANLGVSLGISGKKVVLIDLDFRRPRLHRPFQIENVNGLSDYMLGKCTKQEMIKKTEYHNVSIINRGYEVVNSTSILTSDKLKQLISELRNEYDLIILDCSPVLAVSDYIHISRLSDGVLYVAAYGITKKKHIQEGINLLRQNNANLIGCAMTYFNHKKSSNAYEYEHKYYSYSE